MHGQDTIADETRYWIFGSLMVLAAAGVLVILTLKYPLPKELLGPERLSNLMEIKRGTDFTSPSRQLSTPSNADGFSYTV